MKGLEQGLGGPNGLQGMVLPKRGASTKGSAIFQGFNSLTFNSVTLGNADFTVECWVYNVANGVSVVVGNQFDQFDNDPAHWGLVVRGGIAEWFTQGIAMSAGTVPLNAWTHLACTRSGTTHRLYVNGVQTAVITTLTRTYGTDPNYIGSQANGDASFVGSLSDLRITREVVYTGNFAVPTSPLKPSATTEILVLNGRDFFDSSAAQRHARPNLGVTLLSQLSPYG